MMVQKPAARLGSYKSYLTYKRIIDRIRESPCTRNDVAKALGIEVSNTWLVMRVLVKYGIIKRCRFEMRGGGKSSVYELIKDE